MSNLKEYKALGTKVIVEITEQDKDRYIKDGIHLVETNIEGMKLVKGIILSVGEEAAKDGLINGMKVKFDKHAIYNCNSFGQTSVGTEESGKVVVLNADSIICII